MEEKKEEVEPEPEPEQEAEPQLTFLSFRGIRRVIAINAALVLSDADLTANYKIDNATIKRWRRDAKRLVIAGIATGDVDFNIFKAADSLDALPADSDDEPGANVSRFGLDSKR
jgi:hypothetical protein